jgi:hypothetical protein
MSVYMLFFTGTTPIGNLFTGGIASLFGASMALLAGAVVSILAAIVGWFMRDKAETPAIKAIEVGVTTAGSHD